MKKGFTIAEMMGTIIILCIIALIAFPPILNLVKNTEKELDEKNKELVITQTNSYVNKYANNYPKVENGIYYVTIEELVKESLITNTLVDTTNLELESCVKVSVNNEYKYEYNLEIKCSKGE